VCLTSCPTTIRLSDELMSCLLMQLVEVPAFF
jgi:hypothetical protein